MIIYVVLDKLEHKKKPPYNSSKNENYEDGDSVYMNDFWARRSCDFNSTSEWSNGVIERCYKYRRKSSRHLIEVSISYDTKSHKIFKNDREYEPHDLAFGSCSTKANSRIHRNSS